MTEMIDRKLLGKIQIEMIVKCETGLHIGASKENMEIGALDAPVVRDPITLEPYIPGSSLKGKLRTLLEKSCPDLIPDRQGGTTSNPVWRHECNSRENAEACPVCRIFGSTGKGDNGTNFPARVKVRDFFLTGVSKKSLAGINTGLLYTEWKFENALDRITSAANPRNLERVPKGAEFAGTLVYDLEKTATAQDDLENLKFALLLLQHDSLGGHGSRGYGQVSITYTKVHSILVNKFRSTDDHAADKELQSTIKRLCEIFSTDGHEPNEERS
jgi:CRISPR-associated protein Csm3